MDFGGSIHYFRKHRPLGGLLYALLLPREIFVTRYEIAQFSLCCTFHASIYLYKKLLIQTFS